MQESRHWDIRLNSNTAVVDALRSDVVQFTYKGYTAYITLAEGTDGQITFWWGWDVDGPYEASFGIDGIADAIRSIISRVEQMDAARQALELAKQDAMRVLYDVLDRLERGQ